MNKKVTLEMNEDILFLLIESVCKNMSEAASLECRNDISGVLRMKAYNKRITLNKIYEDLRFGLFYEV